MSRKDLIPELLALDRKIRHLDRDIRHLPSPIRYPLGIGRKFMYRREARKFWKKWDQA